MPTPLITFLRSNSLANCPLCHHWVRLYLCGFFLEESTKPTVAHIIFILGSHTFSKVYGAVALDSWPSNPVWRKWRDSNPQWTHHPSLVFKTSSLAIRIHFHTKWGIRPHTFNYDNRTRNFRHSRNCNRKCNP